MLKKLLNYLDISTPMELLIKVIELILRMIQAPWKVVLLLFVGFFSLCIFLGSYITKEYQYRSICMKMIEQVIYDNWITLIISTKK